jgi:hypothetical protein
MVRTPIFCSFALIFILILALFSPKQFTAQQTPTSPASPSATTQTAGADQKTPPAAQQRTEEDEAALQKKEQSQRLLGVAPLFSVTSRKDAPPLKTGQKFHLFVKSATDPFVFAATGFQAGLSQATNEFEEYGQGAAGYGKRFGASLADSTSSNFFSNFAYPVLLHEDPRYFRRGEGSFKRRFFYSLAQEFVTRTDHGTRTFNWSNVLGAFSTGALSNAYYPDKERGFSLTISRSSISLLYGSAGGLIDEFWPDVQKKWFHKKSPSRE